MTTNFLTSRAAQNVFLALIVTINGSNDTIMHLYQISKHPTELLEKDLMRKKSCTFLIDFVGELLDSQELNFMRILSSFTGFGNYLWIVLIICGITIFF